MTRLFRFASILALVATAASAQTYVRPSKGASITPWPAAPPTPTVPLCTGAATTSGVWPNFPKVQGTGGANAVSTCSQAYDWSAFSGMRITVYSSGPGNNYYGQPCSALIQQYTVPEVGAFVRIKMEWTPRGTAAERTKITILDAPLAAGPYTANQGTNGSYTITPGCPYGLTTCPASYGASTLPQRSFEGCPMYISVLPIPFTAYSEVTLKPGTTSINNFGQDSTPELLSGSLDDPNAEIKMPPDPPSSPLLPTRISTEGMSSIVVGVNANVPSATNGLCIYQYGANINTVETQCFTVSGGNDFAVSVPVVGSTVSLSYKNGPVGGKVQIQGMLKALPQTTTVTSKDGAYVYVTNPSPGWIPDGGSVGSVTQGAGQDGGAWNVSVNNFPTQPWQVVNPDGGAVSPVCSESRTSMTSVGTTPVTMPADGGWVTRRYMRACVSPRNSGTPIVTCGMYSSIGGTPDAGLLGDGESLEVGDCATWEGNSQVSCVSDTAATAVSTWECR